MLAGAHGIDAVVLVVAADESVMPQTREHFHICRLLGVPRGLVALTKCDLADPELLALAELETRELVAGSFLEGAPVLRVSAKTGLGLRALSAALLELARAVPRRPADGLLRLPVDRSFTLHGFGTIVTGTLVSGALGAGDELELLPSGKRTRARGVQVHGENVESVEAGSRAAVNLAGLEVADVTRGDVLARPGTLRPTSLLDVELTLLAGERVLRDQARVRLHVASAEVLARVRLLGHKALEPGATEVAQLRLERPVAAGHGDRLIVRSYSPALTIGGARVLDPLPPKRKGAAASALRALAAASPAHAAALMIEEAGSGGVDAATLAARVTLPVTALLAALSTESGVVSLAGEPVRFVSRRALEALRAATRELLARFHAEHALKAAMPREELRRRLFGRTQEAAFERVLASLAEDLEVKLTPDGVALARHTVRLTPAEQNARGALLEAALAAGLQGLDMARAAEAARHDEALAGRTCRLLLDEGLLRRVGELLVHRDPLDALKKDVRLRWPPGSRLEVATFKELTGLSRKFVIPLLEYLDRERVTRRSGNDRLVLS
jgi:selenocysteine-specific elongation factor